MNGTMKGDWEREYTFVARGMSVIDYTCVNEKLYERIKEFRIGARVDSDHMPMLIILEEGDKGKRETEKEEETEAEEKNKEKEWRICWDEEAIREFREKTEEVDKIEYQQDMTIEEKWMKIKEFVQEALVRKKIKTKRRGIGYKDWWDRMCTYKKRRVKRMY